MTFLTLLFDSNNHRLMAGERRYFINACRGLAHELPFLTKFDLEHVEVYWCDGLEGHKGVTSAFSGWKKRNIYLVPHRNCKDALIPSFIHQMTHYYQRKRLGYFYFLFNLPFIKGATLEAEAKRNEKICDDYLGVHLEFFDLLGKGHRFNIDA